MPVSDAPSRARQTVQAGDILVSLTRPHRGAVAEVRAENDGAIASTGFAVVRDVDSEQVDRDYVCLCLTSSFGCDQMLMRSSGGNYPAITKDELSRVLIPCVSLEAQQRLVAAMDAARAQRKAQLAEADALLAGIDGFVLDTLGINYNSTQKATFAVRLHRSGNFRIDPDFHSLKFSTIRKEIEHGRYSAKRIDELCEMITTGFAAGPQNQAFNYDSGVPHLRPLNLDIFGQLSLKNTKFVPHESVSETNWLVPGEVIFNNTNSTDLVGKSAVFNIDQPCACSNHITRLRTIKGINPGYVASVLNALRRLGYLGLLSTNFNNQAGINTTTLSQLKIPHPPQEIQQTITAEIARRRQQARRLRAAADAGWQAAKQRFEAALLGDSPP